MFNGTLNLADGDNCPDIWKLLEIASVLPIRSTESEGAASGIRKLKTAYKSEMTSEEEGNLNLTQLQSLAEVHVLKVDIHEK